VIKFLDSPQPHCITLRIGDPFTSDEYLQLLNILSETVEKNHKANMLIISEVGKQEAPIDIWVPQSKEIMKAINSIERFAIAGTQESQTWARNLFAPMLDCTNKHFFSAAQIQTAIRWICTGKGILLTAEEQTLIEKFANGQKPYSQWANALLLLDKGTSIKQAAEQTGLTHRQVRYRRDRFLTKRMELFASASDNEKPIVTQKEKTMETHNENQDKTNEPEVEIEETTSISEQPDINESASEEIVEESLLVIAETGQIKEAVPTKESTLTTEDAATFEKTPPPAEASAAKPATKKEKSSKKATKKSKKGKKNTAKKNKSKSKKSKQTKKQVKNKKNKKAKKQKKTKENKKEEKSKEK